MPVYQISLSLLPSRCVTPHQLKWQHHHVLGGESRNLEILTYWTWCLNSLCTPLVLSEPHVKGPAHLSQVLFPAGVLGEGQQRGIHCL